MGTAIHSALEKLFEDNENAITEVNVSFDGLRGHVDLYLRDEGMVVDWKTTKIKNLSYFPSEQQRWQVHLYGYLLQANGFNVKTVQLVGIPRDGTERDIKIHEEPYDPQVAQQALEWFKDVRDREVIPEPEKPVSFCADYCAYFGACAGKVKNTREPQIIDDFDVNLAARDYVKIDSEIKALEAKKEGAREVLAGATGVTLDGIVISWSEMAGRSSIDEAEVLSLLGYVPKKQGNPSQRLTVKKA
jgi:hypothetical protein